MSWFKFQRLIYAVISAIFVVGLYKLLAGHGRGTFVERSIIFLFFLSMLGLGIVWGFESEDTTRTLRDGTISLRKKTFIGLCAISTALSGFLWWLTHPGASDQWVWLLGSVLFGSGGLFFTFWKPKKR